ncbi:MAG: DUF3883 domain-containing protein [Rhabdochlamydiaceae bacterium]
MKWYHVPRPDDNKPIGGGKYNVKNVESEAFNFYPLDREMSGCFQPPSDGKERIALKRIKAGFNGEKLKGVLVVFVATRPNGGGQRLIGWYQNATVWRKRQSSDDVRRNRFSYYLRTSVKNAVLIPEKEREFQIPGSKGGFGHTNVRYTLYSRGAPNRAPWMDQVLSYIESYELENVALEPESEEDPEIDQGAGFQSNPKIRRAIEDYAMEWAKKRLIELGYELEDTHKNKPYDFLGNKSENSLYIEVKGMQSNGTEITLTPNEVRHAENHENSALFIVHSVVVQGEKNPVISGGEELFINPWDISKGTLRPRGYIFIRDDTQIE